MNNDIDRPSKGKVAIVGNSLMPSAIAIALMSVAELGRREPRMSKAIQSPYDDNLAIDKAQAKRDRKNAKRLEIARRNK